MERWLRDIENYLIASDRFEEETDGKNFDLIREALDRMKPKKVVCRHFNKYYGNEIGDCPNCLCTIEDESELNEHPHCKYCGQALDWDE